MKATLIPIASQKQKQASGDYMPYQNDPRSLAHLKTSEPQIVSYERNTKLPPGFDSKQEEEKLQDFI